MKKINDEFKIINFKIIILLYIIINFLLKYILMNNHIIYIYLNIYNFIYKVF